MKVALLRNCAEEGWLSIEVYADHLLHELSRIAPNIEWVNIQIPAWDWSDIRIPTPYGRPASLRTLGIYLSRWIRYPLALRHIRPDVYHILDNSYGHLAFFLDPKRTVVTFHSSTPTAWRQWIPEGPAIWMYDLAFRGTLRAQHVITVSEQLQRALLSETKYPVNRTSVIHHGVNNVFQPLSIPERVKVRSTLLQPDEKHLVLHVGHNAAHKNTEALYRAFALLRQQGWPARLLRVGRLPTSEQSSLVESLGITPWVTFLPPQPNIELPRFYAAADVFAFPSRYEGFGIPLIEALACGVPVACSDMPLFHEVCGECANYFNPEDPATIASALADILGNDKKAATIRQQGLMRARQFTWEQTAQKTLAVYDAILSKSAH